ncbi:MAG: glycine betaine ABC transporter substrate-binding protein [Desulfovibrio sp.]|uniref:glycine betaine ABC transporter substrate-binding protein n=1 Tax=Desulfovibrio sp. 7SRBS1 TaxID=3378064 RepID=UPI003B3D2AD3
MRKLIITCIASLALVAAFGSTVFAKQKVKLAYVEWDCATASTYTAKAALEKMGYEVEVLPVAAAAMWQAVSTGDVDAMVTAWLPVTHKTYYERLKDKVVKLGPVSTGAKLGWAVPSYVTINSIEEINDNADKFDGKIIGIDPGAGLMSLSEKAVDEYGLDKMELMEGSGATMTAALADAIKNKKWAVVTAWSPHWMFGRWDLKYLKDPKGILGNEEQIYTIVRKDLQKDMPKVFNFFKNFGWASPDQLQMVMAWNQEDGADPLTNGKRFIKEYPQMYKKWTGK